jgi:transposase InsO family protein
VQRPQAAEIQPAQFGDVEQTREGQLQRDDDAEALFSTQQLQSRLAVWIDGYYNRERRHSTIGYFSPIVYEQQYIAACTLTTARP